MASSAKCTWVIENYSNLTTIVKKHFCLPEDEKIEFELRFYPKNCKNHMSNYVFIEVDCNNYALDYNARYQLTVVNRKNSSNSIVQDGEFKCQSNIGQCHFQQINVYEPYLRKHDKGFLQDDKLTIECEVHFYKGSSSFKKLKASHIYENICKSFATLLESSKHSDVTFVVGGKHLKLHKCILTACSPVFAAMFDSNLEENKQNRVEITDVDVQVFEELIRYIYSGEIPSVDLYAHELFEVSDKYQLESLKNICEEMLSKILKAETVIATLILADMHSAVHLKSKCLDFVQNNAAEVKSHKDSWSQLKSKPELMMEVLDWLVDKLCQVPSVV